MTRAWWRAVAFALVGVFCLGAQEEQPAQPLQSLRSLQSLQSLQVGEAGEAGRPIQGHAAAQPSFVEGDPARLKTRILRSEEAIYREDYALVRVEVENPGSTWVEPLEFELAASGRGAGRRAARLLPRVQAPFHGRAGRAVPPGGKASYPLVLPLAHKAARSAKLSVSKASFFEGQPVDAPPVRVGAIDEALPDETLQGDKIRRSRIQLTNVSEYELDAVLLARFTNPKKAHTLLQCRLAPHESKAWTVEGIPLDVSNESYYMGSEIESAELVDWSVLRSDRDEQALAALKAAYESWVAWPEPYPSVRGRYSYSYDGPSQETNEITSIRSTGSFELEGEASLSLKPDAGGQEDIRCLLLLQRGLWDLCRKSFEAKLEGRRVQLHEAGETLIVRACDWHQMGDSEGDEYFSIKDGCIVELSRNPLRRQFRRVVPSRVPEGYLVSEIQEMSAPQDPYPHTRWFAHEKLAGLYFPVSLRESNLFSVPGRDMHARISLSAIEVSASSDALPKRAPSGPLAERVRKAWEAAYRYPGEAVDLTGVFQLENPGTDHLWRGHKRVSGKFVLRGFRGSRWDAWEIKLDGKFSESMQLEISAVVEDRFRMGAWRDFSGRKPFDEAFAGAEFFEEKRGIRVEGGFCTHIALGDGLVRSLSFGDTERTFTWRSLGKDLVVASVKTGDEEIHYQHKRMQGWILPTEIEMESVFVDWGPERLTFKSLKLSPVRR